VLFIDASKRFTKAKNRYVLADADIADTVAAYNASFDADGTSVDPAGDGGLAARFVPMTEIVANDYALNISRYIKQVTAEQADLPTLIEAYNLARAERRKTEQRMLAILADAGIEGFDE
jgi:type I restriction enzyme M protein